MRQNTPTEKHNKTSLASLWTYFVFYLLKDNIYNES